MKWVLAVVVNVYAAYLIIRLGSLLRGEPWTAKINVWRIITEVGIFEILLGCWLATFAPVFTAIGPIFLGSGFLGAAAFRVHIRRKLGL